MLIPGDMGTASYVLVGNPSAMEQTWGTTCHGAGRMLSRRKAMQVTKGRSIQRDLEKRGIFVRAEGRRTLHEEVSEAYKDVDEVVKVVDAAGLSRRVARVTSDWCSQGLRYISILSRFEKRGKFSEDRKN